MSPPSSPCWARVTLFLDSGNAVAVWFPPACLLGGVQPPGCGALRPGPMWDAFWAFLKGRDSCPGELDLGPLQRTQAVCVPWAYTTWR